MIILDTHVWVWLVHNSLDLPAVYRDYILQKKEQGLGVSIISCWEIAKLVQNKRLTLPHNLDEWLDRALAFPNLHLLHLTPQIIIDSTNLPGKFHRDPADQLIVATARIYHAPLISYDEKIRRYPHVEIAP